MQCPTGLQYIAALEQVAQGDSNEVKPDTLKLLQHHIHSCNECWRFVHGEEQLAFAAAT